MPTRTETCRGLEFDHSRGIAHRDLKPRIFWLTTDGVAKIGDFGLAVPIDRSRLTSWYTRVSRSKKRDRPQLFNTFGSPGLRGPARIYFVTELTLIQTNTPIYSQFTYQGPRRRAMLTGLLINAAAS